MEIKNEEIEKYLKDKYKSKITDIKIKLLLLECQYILEIILASFLKFFLLVKL